MTVLISIAILIIVIGGVFISGCFVGAKLEANREENNIIKSHVKHKVEVMTGAVVPYKYKVEVLANKLRDHIELSNLIDFREEGASTVSSFTFLTKKK